MTWTDHVAAMPSRAWTIEEAADFMVTTAIDVAADYAERLFLVTLTPPAGRSRRAGARWIEGMLIAHVNDMLGDASRLADHMRFTPAQRCRLTEGRARLFDARLAYLQTYAVLPWGTA